MQIARERLMRLTIPMKVIADELRRDFFSRFMELCPMLLTSVCAVAFG